MCDDDSLDQFEVDQRMSLFEGEWSRTAADNETSTSYVWKALRFGTRANPLHQTPKNASQEALVLQVIGTWFSNRYQRELHRERSDAKTRTASRVIPWGAVRPMALPIDRDGRKRALDAPLDEVRREFGRFRVLLFYTLDPPTEEIINEYHQDLESKSNVVDVGELTKIIKLAPPVELGLVNACIKEYKTQTRMPTLLEFFKFAHARRPQINNNLILAHFPHEITEDMRLVAPAGSYLRYGLSPDAPGGTLHESTESGVRLDYMEVYARAIARLNIIERSSKAPSSAKVRACVAQEYWPKLCQIRSDQARGIDARLRFLGALVVLSCTNPEVARITEESLVRLLRAELELGWPSEHNVVDLLTMRELDHGRIPPEYHPSAALPKGRNGLISSSPSVAAMPPPPTTNSSSNNNNKRHNGNSNSNTSSTGHHLITRAPHAERIVRERFRMALSSGGKPPPFDVPIEGIVPSFDFANSRRIRECAERTEIVLDPATRTYRCNEYNTAWTAGLRMVVTEGYATRFYFVSKGDATEDSIYHELAKELFAQLSPAPMRKLTVRHVPIKTTTDAEDKLVVYPAIVFTTLGQLRKTLGLHAQGQHHADMAEFEPVEDVSSEEVLQPCFENVLTTCRLHLLPSITKAEPGGGGSGAGADGSNSEPHAYEPRDLMHAVGEYRASLHAPLPLDEPLRPSIFWLRPLSDFVVDAQSRNCERSLPIDAQEHLARLPRVKGATAQNTLAFTSGKEPEEALVISYRDVAFWLSQTLRRVIHVERATLNSPAYQGDLVRYVEHRFGSPQPLVLLGVVRRFADSIHVRERIMRGEITEEEAAAGATAEIRCNEDSSDALAYIADDATTFSGDQRQHNGPSTVSAAVQRMRAPNGLHSRDEALQARTERMAEAATVRRSPALPEGVTWKLIESWFIEAERDGERFRDYLWQRGAGDEKKSLGITATLYKDPRMEGNERPSFMWCDWKNNINTGWVGARTLAAYHFAIEVVRAEPEKIWAIRQHIRDNGKDRREWERQIDALAEASPHAKGETLIPYYLRVVRPYIEGRVVPIESVARPAPPPKARVAMSTGAPVTPTHNDDVQEIRRLSVRLSGTVGEPAVRYLREARSLRTLARATLEHSPFLRYSASLPFKVKSENSALGQKRERQDAYPALICLCVSPIYGPVEVVQRIFLEVNKQAKTVRKLPLKDPKRIVGGIVDAQASWCAQPGRIECMSIVYLAEGPETALSVAACSRYACVFATLGMANFPSFSALCHEYAPATRQPLLLLIGDRTAGNTKELREKREQDQKKMTAYATRLRAKGWQRVMIWYPSCACACKDANDVLAKHGLLALQDMLHIREEYRETLLGPDCEHYEPPEIEWQRYACLRKR